jgi:peptidyl-Lys metalloendopeptidase
MPPASLTASTTLRGLLLAALLALGACGTPAAGVQGGAISVSLSEAGLGGAQPAAARHPADIAGPACAPVHTALIEEARQVAQQRTAAAAAFVQQQPGHPHVTRWFGDAPRPEIADRLRRTADQLARPESVKILCNDPPACRGSRMAYAAPGRGIIGLCPGFFRARMDGYDSRWGVLVHEASHLAAGTDDFAYGPTAALILAKQDPRRAARNADSYEYFVETLPR